MCRLDRVKAYVSDMIGSHCRLPDKSRFTVHLFGVSAACALLAAKRRLDPVVASAGGLLHDLYACWTGSYVHHGHSGAEMARVALRGMGCFSDEERLVIQSAIFHHSDKEHIHDPYDELLKDADVLQPFLQNGMQHLPKSGERRMRRMADELNIPFSLSLPAHEDGVMKSPERKPLADIAESVARRNIVGSVENAVFRDIIRYWPEKEAYAELKNGWCAAFVYHCCMLAGIMLPIKYPGAGARLAGVGPWLEWAQSNGFYYDALSSFTPSRGDIIIYNNIIPTDKKPSDSPWHDHIGIILAADAASLTVAEGNVGNDNVSGVVSRSRNENIGGFIRIPVQYEYDGWKYDYKTGNIRVVPFPYD